MVAEQEALWKNETFKVRTGKEACLGRLPWLLFAEVTSCYERSLNK